MFIRHLFSKPFSLFSFHSVSLALSAPSEYFGWNFAIILPFLFFLAPRASSNSILSFLRFVFRFIFLTVMLHSLTQRPVVPTGNFYTIEFNCVTFLCWYNANSVVKFELLCARKQFLCPNIFGVFGKKDLSSTIFGSSQKHLSIRSRNMHILFSFFFFIFILFNVASFNWQFCCAYRNQKITMALHVLW